jgi:hypothetical protein
VNILVVLSCCIVVFSDFFELRNVIVHGMFYLMNVQMFGYNICMHIFYSLVCVI